MPIVADSGSVDSGLNPFPQPRRHRRSAVSYFLDTIYWAARTGDIYLRVQSGGIGKPRRGLLVVSEAEYDSFNAWEAEAQVVFSDTRFAAWFERMVTLVESGSWEFYTLVE